MIRDDVFAGGVLAVPLFTSTARAQAFGLNEASVQGTAAHVICPYGNAPRGNSDVSVEFL